MSWLDAAAPERMRRVAVVAPASALRDVLARVADTGAVELGPASGPEDLAPGFGSQLDAFTATAVKASGGAALAGWMPASKLASVTASLADVGGTVVVLRTPRGVQPPTQVAGRPLRRSLFPLVQVYGTVPYADIAPAWLAWASYVLMFGMMFGDVGEGAALLGVAVALRVGWPRWARRFHQAWPFAGGAGLMATVFGFLYGEFFGRSGVVPELWLDPLDEAGTLLAAAAGIGAAFLAGAYAIGTVNRWREGGWPAMLYAPSGIAGTGLFLGLGAIAAGWYAHSGAWLVAGAVMAFTGVALAAVGFVAKAGGGVTGVMQSVIEVFDLIIRLGSNVVSFTRLAAFGLTHAALGLMVWRGTEALWQAGLDARSVAATIASVAGAIAVLVAGTALAFGLEALVAAVQALRLEYYELFSRVFVDQGRPFRPWHGPAIREESP